MPHKQRKKSCERTSKNLWQPKWHIERNHTGPPSLCVLERIPKITQPDKFLTLWNKKTFVSLPPPRLPNLLNTMMKCSLLCFPPKVPDFPLLCSDHEKDCTKSNSADTDQRRRWRFSSSSSSSSSSLPFSLHTRFFFLHIEGKKVSEIKRKRERESGRHSQCVYVCESNTLRVLVREVSAGRRQESRHDGGFKLSWTQNIQPISTSPSAAVHSLLKGTMVYFRWRGTFLQTWRKINFAIDFSWAR